MITPYGLDVGPGEPAVVQGRRHQHGVEPQVGKPLDLPCIPHATPREELRSRVGAAQRLYQPRVHATPAAHTRDVEDQQAGRSRVRGGPRQLGRGAVMWSRRTDDRHAVSQVEREHDVLRSEGAGYGGEDAERRQRFQTDDDPRGAGRANVPRPHRVRDASVHEQRAAEPREPLQQRGLHRAAHDRIQVGDVALVATQVLMKGARQQDRIALRAAATFRTCSGEHRSDGRVGLAPAAPGQYGAPGAQVEHRDQAQ